MDSGRDHPLIRERSGPRKVETEEPPDDLPDWLHREDPPDLPTVPEPQVVRHYHNLSRESFGVDTGPYLLGSCTMKYNPKLNEDVAGLPGYLRAHPRQPLAQLEGWREVLGDLHEALGRLTGLGAVSLLPAAGAQGDWVGLRVVGAKLNAEGETQRDEVLVPDSAHGTNPASARLAGFSTVEVDSNDRGRVDLDALREATGERTAALMLTNPNTLGLFEEDILEIRRIVHDAGGYLYYDGANLNALVGRIRPGRMGFDVVHLNLHKTFTTPHGAGGPGAGAVAFTEELAPYRPVPRLERDEDTWTLREDAPESIGPIRSYHGNMMVLLRALAYIQRMGETGLNRVGRDAVIASNYLMEHMPEALSPAYPGPCQHEFVVSCEDLPVGADAVAKRLIDFEIHPPTVYFPLIVPEALMIEPTETLSRRELDRIVEVFHQIVEEAREDPEFLREAPHTTRISRPDEAEAARNPVLRWNVDSES